jgi:hypothetical protein
MRPDDEIEVGDAEYVDLKRDGLLVEDTEPPAASALATKKAAPPATTKEG